MKYIPNYEGHYSATKCGKIWSHKTKKFLKFGITNCGYEKVCLSKKGKKYWFCVHRLIAETFLKKDKGKIVNHKNGIKADNRVENLEWVTQSENHRHARKLGLNKGPRGELQGQSKLKKEEVLEIRKLYKTGNYSQRKLAEKFKVNQGHIGKIVRRERWSHLDETEN